MTEINFSTLNDGHVHIFKVAHVLDFPKLVGKENASKVGVACQSDLGTINDNAAGFCLKAGEPGRFYMLGGLDHSGQIHGNPDAPALADQARNLFNMGVDGIKLLVTKPNSRKRLDAPLDGPYFKEFFPVCEELDIPLLWHVADPEEFWDPSQLPKWARAQGWGYDSSFPTKEDLYQETENILSQHPGLRVVFPHFYFLSADLERAESFLTRFPNVKLDLAPGIELYYNLSAQWGKAREFFCAFADRILFGTDIMSINSQEEAFHRAGIVYRFLVGKEEFRVPGGADFLLGKPGDGVIKGLDLPEEAARLILENGFLKQYGSSPRKLDMEEVKKECERLSAVEAGIKSCSESKTEGAQALELLFSSEL